jgi:two-component sensor histidine kinase/putative methionine-R-sulfoxide reductase with GAF domain
MSGMDAEMSSSRERSRGREAANELISELLGTEPSHGGWPGKSRKMVRLAERYGAEAALAQLALPETLDRFLSEAQARERMPNGALLNGIINGYQRVMMAGDQRVGQASVGTFSDHVTRLSALRRINQAATASLNLEAMMQTVVGVVRDTMGCQSCSIFLMDEGNAMLVLSASVGLNPQAIGRIYMPLGTGITGKAAQTRQLLAIPDAVAHPAYIDYPLLDDQRYSSQVSVPMALRSPDRLVGVLNILSIRRREFDEDELAFLETAAGEIAIAIENARLYSQTDAELQRRISQLSTLQQMSRMVASTLELDDLLQLICEQTSELSNAVGVEIYRLQRSQPTRLELLKRHSPEAVDALNEASLAVRQLVDDVMNSGAAIWRNASTGADDLYVHGLPMLTGRRAVGVICVFHRARPADESEASTLLDAFCDSAAIAIENADLYEEARRGYTRASILLQEMHHRVRNNLQTVAALLSMQARHSGDERSSAPLREAVSRIQSIAAIHDILSGRDLRETTVDTIAKHVVDDATSNLVGPDTRISFSVEPSSVHVSSREATVLALLINEFVMNAIRHGFPGRSTGSVSVRSRNEAERAVIEVVDDGVGLPESFSVEENRRLGLNIARTLVQVDLRGTLDLIRGEEGGTIVRIAFVPSGAPDQ